MSFFKSKLFWTCVLLCVITVGAVVMVYQSLRAPQETIYIYKSTQPPPHDVSDETSEPEPAAPQNAEGTVPPQGVAVEPPETDPFPYVQSNTDDRLSNPDGTQANEQQSEDIQQTEDILQIRDTIVTEEINAVLHDLQDTYPILRMSETEIREMLETDEGRSEVVRQSREAFSTLTSKLTDAMILYSPEEREEFYSEARSILLQNLSADQVDQMINQIKSDIESRIRRRE